VSTLQRNELLTQSEIFEKETSPPTKEADQHSEAEPDEVKHGQDWSGFITERRWDASSYVIDFTVGWSFGEPQLEHAGLGDLYFDTLKPWREMLAQGSRRHPRLLI
jgi:hypothetical protein